MYESWQDIVLAVGGLLFALALLPSIFGEDKPSKWTSLMTATVLSSFSIVYFSLELHYAMFTTLLAAVGWLTLFIQKIRH